MIIYIVLIISSFLSLIVCQIKSLNKISPEKPPDSLFSPQVIGSIFGQLIPQMVFITVMYFLMIREPWYIEPKTGSEVIYNVHCTAVMFWFCNYQYLTPGFLFAFGRDFHKPVYKCFWVMFICTLILFANTFVLFQDFDPISDFFEFPNGDCVDYSSSSSIPLENPCPVPYSFRWKIFGMAVLNFVVCMAVEEFMIRALPGIVKKYKDRYGDNEAFTPKVRSEFERLCHRNNYPGASPSPSAASPAQGFMAHSPEAISDVCSESISPHGDDTEPLIQHGKKRGKRGKMDQMLARYEKSIRKSRGKSPGRPEDDDIGCDEGDDYYGASGFSGVPSGGQTLTQSPSTSSSALGQSGASGVAAKNKKSKGKGKGRNRNAAASGIVTTSSMPSVVVAGGGGGGGNRMNGSGRKKMGKKKGSVGAIIGNNEDDEDSYFNDGEVDDYGDEEEGGGDIHVQISDDDNDKW